MRAENGLDATVLCKRARHLRHNTVRDLVLVCHAIAAAILPAALVDVHVVLVLAVICASFLLMSVVSLAAAVASRSVPWMCLECTQAWVAWGSRYAPPTGPLQGRG